MKTLSESILNGGADNAVDTAVDEQELLDTISKINDKSRFSLKNKFDSWGHPVEIGDVIIGYVDNGLRVCRITDIYNNGMLVQLGGSLTNQPLPLWMKRGFIKIDPQLLSQIFSV